MTSEYDQNSGLPLDCITYNPIEPNRLFIIKEDETEYFFDIETIYRNYLETGEVRNMYTTNLVSLENDLKVRMYGESQKIIIRIFKKQGKNSTFLKTIRANSFSTYGDIPIILFRSCNELSMSDIVKYNLTIKGKSIYNLNLDTTINEKILTIDICSNDLVKKSLKNLLKFLSSKGENEYIVSYLNFVNYSLQCLKPRPMPMQPTEPSIEDLSMMHSIGGDIGFFIARMSDQQNNYEGMYDLDSIVNMGYSIMNMGPIHTVPVTNTTTTMRNTRTSVRNTSMSASNTTTSVRNTRTSVRNTSMSASNTTTSVRNTTTSILRRQESEPAPAPALEPETEQVRNVTTPIKKRRIPKKFQKQETEKSQEEDEKNTKDEIYVSPYRKQAAEKRKKANEKQLENEEKYTELIQAILFDSVDDINECLENHPEVLNDKNLSDVLKLISEHDIGQKRIFQYIEIILSHKLFKTKKFDEDIKSCIKKFQPISETSQINHINILKTMDLIE